MRRNLASIALPLLCGLLLAASTPAAGHWVKVEGNARCDGVWVDQDPTNNGLLGPDPSALVVTGLCMPCSGDVEAGSLKLVGCGNHG